MTSLPKPPVTLPSPPDSFPMDRPPLASLVSDESRMPDVNSGFYDKEIDRWMVYAFVITMDSGTTMRTIRGTPLDFETEPDWIPFIGAFVCKSKIQHIQVTLTPRPW